MTGIGMLTPEDQLMIENELGEFLKKSEAQWSALVDKGGNLFAQSGDTGTLDLSILSALAAGSFAATHELAKRLGESEFSALYHEGQGMHILMSALHHECLLVTIFGDKTNIGLVRFYAQQVTGVLNQMLKQVQEKEAASGPLVIDGDFLSQGGAVIS
jgi:predicted regulator of Ras-like GTPase activity (Roadblock/LC7/MglB family)